MDTRVYESQDAANNAANAKAEQLTTQYGSEVHPLVINIDEDNWAIGFLKEPPRAVKLEAIARISTQDPVRAGEFLFNTCLLVSDSDPIFTSQNSKDDSVVMAGILAAAKVIKVKQDVSKKNS